MQVYLRLVRTPHKGQKLSDVLQGELPSCQHPVFAVSTSPI